MYSTKLSRNNLLNKPVIKIHYCEFTSLLNYFERIGYNAGVYGWNCDVYDFGSAYIVTGYRTSHIHGIQAGSFIVNCFDDAAARIRWDNRNKTYKEIQQLLNEKMQEFIHCFVK